MSLKKYTFAVWFWKNLDIIRNHSDYSGILSCWVFSPINLVFFKNWLKPELNHQCVENRITEAPSLQGSSGRAEHLLGLAGPWETPSSSSLALPVLWWDAEFGAQVWGAVKKTPPNSCLHLNSPFPTLCSGTWGAGQIISLFQCPLAVPRMVVDSKLKRNFHRFCAPISSANWGTQVNCTLPCGDCQPVNQITESPRAWLEPWATI